jgi:hypothetical protein
VVFAPPWSCGAEGVRVLTVKELLEALPPYPGMPVLMRAGWGLFVIDEAIIFPDKVRLYTATIMRWGRVTEAPGQPKQLKTCSELAAALAGVPDSTPVWLSGTAAKQIPFEVHVTDACYLDGTDKHLLLHPFPEMP